MIKTYRFRIYPKEQQIESMNTMLNGLHQFKMAQYSVGLYICTNI